MANTILALGTLGAEGSKIYVPPDNSKVTIEKWFIVNNSGLDVEKVSLGFEKAGTTVNIFSNPLKAGWSVDLIDCALEVDSKVTLRGGLTSNGGNINFLLIGEVEGQQR